jgi:hypothetical protein
VAGGLLKWYGEVWKDYKGTEEKSHPLIHSLFRNANPANHHVRSMFFRLVKFSLKIKGQRRSIHHTSLRLSRQIVGPNGRLQYHARDCTNHRQVKHFFVNTRLERR